MTKTTDSRQLRMLVDGILANYLIDNLQLSIDICAAVKAFYASPTPAHTREEILARLQKSVARGENRQFELDVIRQEIADAVHINPTGEAWEAFIKWAWGRQKEGQPISVFLAWWTEDEWRRNHPPSRPDNWYVQWPQAFVAPKESGFKFL